MGKRVTLHYEEKVGLPTTCFGETRHFVNNVTVSEEIPARRRGDGAHPRGVGRRLGGVCADSAGRALESTPRRATGSIGPLGGQALHGDGTGGDVSARRRRTSA